MDTLLGQLKKLNIKTAVKKKLKEFERGYLLPAEEKFIELCFCLLVANCGLEPTFKIWQNVGKNFLKLSEKALSARLKKLGYRFYNKRAAYVVAARKSIKVLDEIVVSATDNEVVARERLVHAVKGVGWKEASHFLRNMGHVNFAILDRHILKMLARHKVINELPKTLTRKKYLQIEGRLKKVAARAGLNMAELDVYLFYLDAGRLCGK